MSKYEPLWKYLQTGAKELLTLSYDDIKAILGFDIDHSFLSYKKEALQYGYRVGKISMKEKRVIFHKDTPIIMEEPGLNELIVNLDKLHTKKMK